MAIYETYERRKGAHEGNLDVYIYDSIPYNLRVQFIQIFSEVFQNMGTHLSSADVMKGVVCQLRKEFGVYFLWEEEFTGLVIATSYDSHDYFKELFGFIHSEQDIDRLISVIEYVCNIIKQYQDEFKKYKNEKMSSYLNESLYEINYRFKQHGIGFEYMKDNLKIVSIESVHIHSEVVKPVLTLLNDPIFKAAEISYVEAYGYFMKKNYSQTLICAAKSLESTLKIILSKCDITYNEKENLPNLIDTILKHSDLVDQSLEKHFTSLKNLLKSSVSGPRGELAAHGKEIPTIIPEHIAEFVLYSTAASLLFLVKIYRRYKNGSNTI